MAKKRKEEPKGGLAPWMATYGDLVTLLLCFFILLFSMSSVDATKYQAVVESFEDRFGFFNGSSSIFDGSPNNNNGGILDDVDFGPGATNNGNQNEVTPTPVPSQNGTEDAKGKEMAETISKYFNKSGMDSVVLVSYTANFVKMTVAGELLFDSGEATINHGERILEAISNIMVKNGYTKYKLNIEGHTDNVPMTSGKYPSNWYLSSARAIAVGERLIGQYNFNPAMILCTGYGEYLPIASNNTSTGRAKNRRVEFKIHLNTEK